MATTALAKVKQELELTRPTFDQLNINGLSFHKELEFAMQIFEKNDYLLKMSPGSIKNCLVNACLAGVSLNPVTKYAYLVPRGKELCLDVSYVGLMKIVTDTGSVKSMRADVAYEKDTFDIDLGSNGFVKHKPYLGVGPRGRKLGAYSVAILNDGSVHVDFMTWAEILAIKARSQSVISGKKSPWDTDEDEMAAKTVAKRHFKYLPKSERAVLAANAINFENQANGIDLDKEKEIKSDSPDGATPGLDDYDEMASDSIVSTLLEKLDHEALANVEIFHYIQMSAKKMKGGITKAHDAGTLTAEKAQQYNEFLDAEIKWATENPPTETAEGVDGEQPAEETQEKGE